MKSQMKQQILLQSNNDKVTEVVNETNDTTESNKIEENTNSSIGNVVSEVLKK